MARSILHVDMDAFFAAVEMRDRPELRGKPVLVGGSGARGVVAAASYEARRFGCRSAQPMAVSLRRCPQAVVVPPRRDAYLAASRRVFAIFSEFSPLVEALSIDEAFLDVTGAERLLGSPATIAAALQARVYQQTSLTCSVGISAVKFVAKIASGLQKPAGVVEVMAGDEAAFLAPLPITHLWGVGARAEERLRARGVDNIAALRALGEDALERMFGAHGRHLHQLSRGCDERPVVPGRAAKSISHEDTFATDLTTPDEVRRQLLQQSERVADRLMAADLGGHTVQLKIRDHRFRTETRQATRHRPTGDSKVIYGMACALLRTVDLKGRRFRLTGVTVAGLMPAGSRQLELLPTSEPTGERLQGVKSAIRQRFGERALFAAEGGGTREDATGAVTSRPAF